MLPPVWLEPLRSLNDGGREGLTIDTNCVAVHASVADALRILQADARDEAANSTCALSLRRTLSQFEMRGKRGKGPSDPLSRYYSGNAVTANILNTKGKSVTALPSGVVYVRFSLTPPFVVVTWINGPPPPIVKS
jgi:hypothetical protein